MLHVPDKKVCAACMCSGVCTFTVTSDMALGAGIAQLVVLGLAVHSVAGSILLWGHFR